VTSAEREANSEIKHTEEPILYEPVFKPVLRLDQRMMHALILMLSRIWFRVYARWRVIGLEHIPLAGGVLIVANHSSNIDALLGWAAVHKRRRMWGVAKVELWQRPLLRYCMYAIGGIPVHRGVADRTFIRTVLDLLARGEVVGLFPEGTRTLDGKLQPAQPGIALLALKSGVPVVPLALIGSVAALWIAGQPLSVASMVGFITLTGISARNGILKVSHYINLVLHEGEVFGPEMVVRGSLERLAPVLMTALSAGFALLPLIVGADAPGKEILHPVAITIFGGLVSATLLDTLLTPVLFLHLGRKPLERLLQPGADGLRPAEAF